MLPPSLVQFASFCSNDARREGPICKLVVFPISSADALELKAQMQRAMTADVIVDRHTLLIMFYSFDKTAQQKEA